MKATEARKLTNENLKGPVIQPALNIIYRKISGEARGGKCTVSDPYRGMMGLDSDKKKAIELQLQSDGYKITETAAYDDGPGRYSPSYITISW